MDVYEANKEITYPDVEFDIFVCNSFYIEPHGRYSRDGLPQF